MVKKLLGINVHSRRTYVTKWKASKVSLIIL